jgi:hypothetical protein
MTFSIISSLSFPQSLSGNPFAEPSACPIKALGHDVLNHLHSAKLLLFFKCAQCFGRFVFDGLNRINRIDFLLPWPRALLLTRPAHLPLPTHQTSAARA